MANTATAPKKYATRKLVRGEDGLLDVIYVDAQTGQQIPDDMLSRYTIANNMGTKGFGGNFGEGRKDKDEENDKDKKKKKKDKPTPFDAIGDSESSNYADFMKAAPTQKLTGNNPTLTDSTETSNTSELEQGDNNANAPTPNDGLVRSLEETPGKLNEGPVSSAPTPYDSNMVNTRITNNAEVPGYVDYSVQPTNVRTLGLMEDKTASTSTSQYSRANWTDEDRQAVAQTLAGEIDQRKTDMNSEEGRREINAIMTSIENRAIALGISPADVVTQQSKNGTYQYTSWAPTELPTTTANYNQKQDAFNGFVDNYLSDPNSRMGNFTNYHANYVNPGWSQNLQNREVIGAHTFGYDQMYNLPQDIDVMGAKQTLPGIINTDVQSTAGFIQNPDLPVNKVSVTSVPNTTESGLLPSLNQDPDVGRAGNTNRELGFQPGIRSQSVQSSQWNPDGTQNIKDGFGDYFNPENLSYDPRSEPETLSDSQDVDRINRQVEAGFPGLSSYDYAPMSVDSITAPAVDPNSPSYSVDERRGVSGNTPNVLTAISDTDLSGTEGIHTGGSTGLFGGYAGPEDGGYHRGTPGTVPNAITSESNPGGFGDYFNPEDLSYDPTYESQTLSDSQDVDRINRMSTVNPTSIFNSAPVVDPSSPSYSSSSETGMTGQGDGFGNPYGPQGFGPDPSGTDGSGGFGQGEGGDVGGPTGPNTVGGYTDGGFHNTTPSYSPSTDTSGPNNVGGYTDGGFHSQTPSPGTSAAVSAVSSTFDSGRFSNTPASTFDADRFGGFAEYTDGGFHNTAPSSEASNDDSGGDGW